MKVAGCPEGQEFKRPGPEAGRAELSAAVNAHKDALRQWLSENNYTGKNSGGIFSLHVPGGKAYYMLAETEDGRGNFLVHLPYMLAPGGGSFHDPNVEFMPLRGVLANIEAERQRIAEAAAQREAKLAGAQA